MTKDPKILLQHILESIEWIEKDVSGLTEDQFYENVPIQDAVIRRIEIIGEAARHLPIDFRQADSETPWQDIADMRNKLIHEYFSVDLDLVWEVIKRDIPNLKQNVQKLLKSEISQ